MLYNTFCFSFVALLPLFSPICIYLSFSPLFFFQRLLFSLLNFPITFPPPPLCCFHEAQVTPRCQTLILSHQLLFQCFWATLLTFNCSAVAVHWLTAENWGEANWCFKWTSTLSKPSEEESRERKHFNNLIIELLSAQWLLIIVIKINEFVRGDVIRRGRGRVMCACVCVCVCQKKTLNHQTWHNYICTHTPTCCPHRLYIRGVKVWVGCVSVTHVYAHKPAFTQEHTDTVTNRYRKYAQLRRWGKLSSSFRSNLMQVFTRFPGY